MPILHPNKINDLKFGDNNECSLLPLFRKQYGADIKKSTYRYSFFDYSDDQTLLELKSRRINHDKYPTALCNLEKIKKLAQDPRQAYLIFSYLDGVFEIPIRENWKKWATRINTRSDRGKNESATVCLIPYNELVCIKQSC